MGSEKFWSDACWIKPDEKIWPVYSHAMQEHFGDKLTPSDFLGLQQILKKIFI